MVESQVEKEYKMTHKSKHFLKKKQFKQTQVAKRGNVLNSKTSENSIFPGPLYKMCSELLETVYTDKTTG